MRECELGKERERIAWERGNVKGEDADGMTVWLTSGSCLHQCLLVGGGCKQIYSDFEQALHGSNRHLKTPYFLYPLICSQRVKV